MFYDRINTIYQFIKPFLDNKMSIFEEMEPLSHQYSSYEKLSMHNNQLFVGIWGGRRKLF